MDDPVIQIESVSKAFESRSVLRNVTAEISKSESVFICGINGAGKSTLLRLICGLISPDSGKVRFCGENIADNPEKVKPHLGVISHKSMTYPDLTVTENLRFFADLYDVKNASKRIEEMINHTALGPFRYDRAGILSRGLLQRLAIARALIHAPKVLLADEPFTGLDNDSCQHLRSIFDAFIANSGTIIMTTHDTRTGLACCSKVMVLDKGSIVLNEATDNIDQQQFLNDYVAYARSRQ